MYSTQMEAAKKGIFTKEMEIVARDENMTKEELMEKMAQGRVVIPANINHKNLYPRAVGEGTKTKVNVNLGVSEDCCDSVSYTHLPEKLIIIGGGYIGLEYANMYNNFGSEVVVLEGSPLFIAREDREIEDEIKKVMERKGDVYKRQFLY